MDKVARLLVDGVDVAQVVVADTFGRRLRGMLGRHPLPDALILVPANSVHGIGMRETLDVAVLDREGTVLDVTVLRPMGLTRTVRHGRQVLEAPVGSFDRWGLGPGSRVEVAGPR
ncbi:MAG: DUF192 domain-containing protein [Micrococcales bacterium]|nr:DUF192 domain-containing protein [Micrococcales bacterium]